MNVSLRYEVDWPSAIYYVNQDASVPNLQLNFYSAKICMLTNTEDPGQINLAMDRAKTFVYQELTNTVFINGANETVAKTLELMGASVTTLPEEPLDQIVGMMLYCKLNAIMCDRILVTALELSSKLGDQIWYQHESQDNLGPFSQAGWWKLSNLQHNDLVPQSKQKKVKKLPNVSWQKYDLEWPNERAVNEATVVFADFKHNES